MAERNVRKEIRYLNKDFVNFRNGLIDFAKIYFPQTYQNFNESSTGMMFIEMASYVGDVLSYYVDNSLKESLLLYAEEEKNIFALSQALGYTPVLSSPAHVKLDVFHLVPANGSGENIGPDWRYALTIAENMQVQSEENSDVIFRTTEPVNFKVSSSLNATDVSIFELDNNNVPTFYLLKKTVPAIAGEIKEEVLTFGAPERFATANLPDTNIIEIIDATDADSNSWYHVPYLAQDTIFESIENVAANDSELAQYNNTVPYLLKLRKTARRFTTKILADRKIQLQFGSGISSNPDELIIPNPTNIGSNLVGSVTFLDNPIDPANFLYTKTYGQSPSNTTITVRYTVGGGVESNVNQNDLVNIRSVTVTNNSDSLDTDLVSQVEASVAVNNPLCASGGKSGETVEEIRNNALAHFSTQQRAVTREDYISRIYSLPPRFGGVSKAYIVQDDQLNSSRETTATQATRAVDAQEGTAASITLNQTRNPNPLALNLYLLGYDKNKNLAVLNEAIKENIKIYIGQYRMLTDAINIKDAYIVNVGIKFQIIAFKNYNKREVVLRCIDKLKAFFDIEKWQVNQPIVIADIQRELFSVEGVQSVVDVEIVNKYKAVDGYSGNIYDILGATRDGIIYPSLDPSIFELKYPNQDIEGKAL